jgi:hypothetical protein
MFDQEPVPAGTTRPASYLFQDRTPNPLKKERNV